MIKYSDLKAQIKDYWFDTVAEGPQIETLIELIAERFDKNDALFKASSAGVTSMAEQAFYQEPYIPIVVNRDDNLESAVIRYDPNSQYTYSENGIVYGQETYTIVKDLPDYIESCSLIVSSPFYPEMVLVKGVDYIIDKIGTKKILKIFGNKFESDVAIKVQDNYYLVLWLKYAKVVNQNYFKLSTYDIDSTVSYDAYSAKIASNVYSSYANGTSIKTFVSLLSGIFQAPIATDEEEVLLIVDNKVITTKNLYDTTGFTVAVSVGDILNVGDAIVEEFKLFVGTNIKNAQKVTIKNIPGSSKAFDMVFTQAPGLPTMYGYDEDGYSKIALPGTVNNEFWDIVHQKGKQSGKTLCKQLYGMNAITQTAISRPVNSIQLLAETVFRNDYLLQVSAAAIDLTNFDKYKHLVYNILSPGINFLVESI